MAILHTLNKHSDHPAFNNCLRCCRADGGIFLLENGVYAVRDSAENLRRWQACQSDKIYARKVDVEARGLTQGLMANVTLADEARFVELCLEFDSVVSWF